MNLLPVFYAAGDKTSCTRTHAAGRHTRTHCDCTSHLVRGEKCFLCFLCSLALIMWLISQWVWLNTLLPLLTVYRLLYTKTCWLLHFVFALQFPLLILFKKVLALCICCDCHLCLWLRDCVMRITLWYVCVRSKQQRWINFFVIIIQRLCLNLGVAEHWLTYRLFIWSDGHCIKRP